MELVIDEGNSRIKAAWFINNGINKVWNIPFDDRDSLQELLSLKPDSIIISTTRGDSSLFPASNQKVPTIFLDHTTPLPIQSLYKTPETLGKDRIAAVIGARFLIPIGNILTIDAGTCITYDFLSSSNQYLGGMISPGTVMRFKAMHQFTGALPDIRNFNFTEIIGSTTEESMSAGVMCGLIDEINGHIQQFEEKFSPLNVALCGGDAGYFVNHIKKKIFANQNLVLLGLHKILKFNDK